MKKYTSKDVHDWKVVSFGGKVLPYYTKNKEGKDITVLTFDGFKSANAVAKKLGGVAVRS